VSFGALSANVSCIIEGIVSLKGIKGKVGVMAGQAANAIPSDIIDAAAQAAPLLGVAIIVPAAFIAIIQLLVVFFSTNPCKKSSLDECCARFLIFFLQFFLLIGFVCYVAVGGAGIALGTAQGQAVTAQVDEICNVQIPTLDLALTDAKATLSTQQAKLDAAPVSSPQIDDLKKTLADAKFEMDEATKMVDSFTGICTCVKGTFTTLATFMIPGFGCAVACLLLFFLNFAACCLIGSKKKPKGDSDVEMQQSV